MLVVWLTLIDSRYYFRLMEALKEALKEQTVNSNN